MRNTGHIIPWTLEVPLFIGIAHVGNYPDLDCRMLLDDDGDLYGVELDVTINGKLSVIEIGRHTSNTLGEDIWQAAVIESQTPMFRAAVREGLTESLLDVSERRYSSA